MFVNRPFCCGVVLLVFFALVCPLYLQILFFVVSGGLQIQTFWFGLHLKPFGKPLLRDTSEILRRVSTYQLTTGFWLGGLKWSWSWMFFVGIMKKCSEICDVFEMSG